MNCSHDKATFLGWASLIGGYQCDYCKMDIDPVIYHKIKNYPHVLFNPKNKEKLGAYLSRLDKNQLELLK